MHGLITGKDVLRHFPLIWREFGPRCAMKALTAVLRGKRTTFLDVACTQSRGVQKTPAPRVERYRN